MSKSICLVYRMVVALTLLVLSAAAAAIAGLLMASRTMNGAWSGEGTRTNTLIDHASLWGLYQISVHGAGISIVASAVAVSALLLLLLVLRRMVQRTPRLILSRGGLGEVAVDLRQVGLLAQHEAERVTGVREVDTEAASGKAGLDVQQTVAVEPEMAFAPLAEQVQQRVKRSLEFHLGMPVARVQVLLRHTAMRKGPM